MNLNAKNERDGDSVGLHVHICKRETLQEAHKMAENNRSAGIAGSATFLIGQQKMYATLSESTRDLLRDRIRCC
jgi:hypothetical protein